MGAAHGPDLGGETDGHGPHRRTGPADRAGDTDATTTAGTQAPDEPLLDVFSLFVLHWKEDDPIADAWVDRGPVLDRLIWQGEPVETIAEDIHEALGEYGPARRWIYGDPAGENRESDQESWISNLNRCGPAGCRFWDAIEGWQYKVPGSVSPRSGRPGRPAACRSSLHAVAARSCPARLRKVLRITASPPPRRGRRPGTGPARGGRSPGPGAGPGASGALCWVGGWASGTARCW